MLRVCLKIPQPAYRQFGHQTVSSTVFFASDRLHVFSLKSNKNYPQPLGVLDGLNFFEKNLWLLGGVDCRGKAYLEQFSTLAVFLNKNRVHEGRRGERQHCVYTMPLYTMPQCIFPKVAVVNLGVNKFYSHVSHCHPFRFILCHLHL